MVYLYFDWLDYGLILSTTDPPPPNPPATCDCRRYATVQGNFFLARMLGPSGEDTLIIFVRSVINYTYISHDCLAWKLACSLPARCAGGRWSTIFSLMCLFVMTTNAAAVEDTTLFPVARFSQAYELTCRLALNACPVSASSALKGSRMKKMFVPKIAAARQKEWSLPGRRRLQAHIHSLVTDDDSSVRQILTHSFKKLADAGRMEASDWPHCGKNGTGGEKSRMLASCHFCTPKQSFWPTRGIAAATVPAKTLGRQANLRKAAME
jgi:hypothetical protein